MCFTNNPGHDTLLAREQLTKITVCSIMSRSLCLLYNHLMSYSKVLMTVVNFETQDHTQRDVAISTVSMRTFLPCLLCEQHTLQRLVGCCLPAVGSEDLGNCRAVSHSLQTAESTIRYDTRCYFNVRSKADMSQLNLPHRNDN